MCRASGYTVRVPRAARNRGRKRADRRARCRAVPVDGMGLARRFAGMNEHFRRFAAAVSTWVGTSWVFLAATLFIAVWAASGPLFGYSDHWQLIVNTATTIVTFLMVFLIQNTQNRDAKAIHLKLDELIRAVKGARNRLVDLQDLTDTELDELQKEFQRLRARAEARLDARAERSSPANGA